MATLDSLAADVYTLTNRPDLVAETKVALRKSIIKFHSADTYKRDIVSQTLQMSLYPPLDVNQFRWNIALTTFPRFRRPRQLTTSTLNPTVTVFKEVASDNIFNLYGSEFQNYFFISGSSITIKAIAGFDYLNFQYYQYPLVPPVSTDPITSWICDQYPDAVIEEAAGTVFKMIGKDDEYSRYQTLFAENIMILRGTDVGEGV